MVDQEVEAFTSRRSSANSFLLLLLLLTGSMIQLKELQEFPSNVFEFLFSCLLLFIHDKVFNTNTEQLVSIRLISAEVYRMLLQSEHVANHLDPPFSTESYRIYRALSSFYLDAFPLVFVILITFL